MEPKVICIRRDVPTEVLNLGLKVLASKKFPEHRLKIHHELERRMAEMKPVTVMPKLMERRKAMELLTRRAA